MLISPSKFSYYLQTFLLLVFAFFLFGSPSKAQQNPTDPTEWEQILATQLTRANTLYSKEIGDLNLATSLIKKIAFHDLAEYYPHVQKFYFFSLKKSSFERNPELLEKEARSIMPLLDDSLNSAWEGWIQQQDDQLSSNIIKFWHSTDPVISTSINERLFEHWYRISYAQQNFTRNTDSPYNTDDRGTVFVRLGAPDLNVEKNLRPGNVLIPSAIGEDFIYDLSTASSIKFIFWSYNDSSNKKMNQYYLFGEKEGKGKFGLRKDPVELLNLDQINLQASGSNKIASAYKKALIYRTFQELTPYHSDYNQHYSFMKDQISAADGASSARIQETGLHRTEESEAKLIKSMDFLDTFMVQKRSQYQRKNYMQQAASSVSNLLRGRNKIKSNYKVFRFVDKKGHPEFALALKPELKTNNFPESATNTDSFLLNTFVSSYKLDESYTRKENCSVFSPGSLELTNLFTVKNSDVARTLTYSMEVVDTTAPNMRLPIKLGLSPQIKGATGQQKIDLPTPLTAESKLTISDIIVGKYQKESNNHRLPIIPSLDMEFDQNSDVIIYFETYDLPEDGYSFTYYFKRKRWLGAPEKVEERSEVTILAEDAKDRDDQLFTINLYDLEPGSYQLIFEFSPMDQTSTIGKREKTVSFEIID